MTSPTLPPPPVGGPAAPPPPPTLPTLPPPSIPPLVPPDGLPPLPDAIVPPALGAPDPPVTTPPTSPNERPRRRVRAVLALVAIVALAGGAWWFLGRDAGGSEDPAEPVVDSSDGVSGADVDPSIGQIGVDAMNDAGAVADALTADQGEADLLAELGLGPTGEPLVEMPTDVGHEFSWTFADGLSATIVVNTVTGDHSYTDSGGLSFRQVGELSFGRTSADAPWAMIDASELTDVQRIGLDHPITTDDLVGGPVAAHLSVSGDGSLWSIDDEAFQASDPSARDAWVAALGLPSTEPTGPITVWVSTAGDGITVSSASVERAATGERVAYELNRRFSEPPVIEAPTL